MDLAFIKDSWVELREGAFFDDIGEAWDAIERQRQDGPLFVYLAYSSGDAGYPVAGLWKIGKKVVIPTIGEDFNITRLRFGQGFYEFRDAIREIKTRIREGYTYQVNYTFPVEFDFSGSPVALFFSLLRFQPVEWPMAVFFKGRFGFLCLSPELFFEMKGRDIVMEPMKGTWSVDETFVVDEKTKAENLMIVDMIRNDLGRVSCFGSVEVDLFIRRDYKTLVQLISRVRSRLKDNLSYRQLFSALFPCASITGAPKLETMSIIDDLEEYRRGIYTGAIGVVDGDYARFSVAIRTVELDLLKRRGRLGIGSGIVWDSRSHREYAEDLLKARFFFSSVFNFHLIETMRLEDGDFPLLEYHFQRLEEATTIFGFRYPHMKIRRALDYLRQEYKDGLFRVRLSLFWDGTYKLEVSPFYEDKEAVWRLMLMPFAKLASREHLLYKTSLLREYFDETLRYARDKGYDEVLFYDKDGYLLQGCISNLFLEEKGELFTPPLSLGLLNGVYRRYMLGSGKVREARVCLDDLMEGRVRLYMGNALRYLIPATCDRLVSEELVR